MTKAVSIIAAGLVLIAFAYSSNAMAIEKPNVLVMGEDADEDTVPRNSRVFRRVLDAVASQLDLEGFDVFDETALTLDDFAQGRVRRTDAEVLEIARTITRPPIDVVVLFSIYASAEERAFTTKVKTRIEGRMINAHTGRRLGSFSVASPGEWNAPKDCPRECLLEVVVVSAASWRKTLARSSRSSWRRWSRSTKLLRLCLLPESAARTLSSLTDLPPTKSTTWKNS